MRLAGVRRPAQTVPPQPHPSSLYTIAHPTTRLYRHPPPPPPPPSRLYQVCSPSNWVATAWSCAHLTVTINNDTFYVKRPKQPSNHLLLEPYFTPLFPDMNHHQMAAHFCRVVLAATPHLRHLLIHSDTSDTRSYGHMADLADTLDMLPALHSLVLRGEADEEDCPYLDRLFIPVSEVLTRHPRLHALRCYGAVDISMSDLLAIASHSGLAHIDVSGDLHNRDVEQDIITLKSPCSDPRDMTQWFGEWQDENVGRGGDGRPWCGGCTSSSVTARLALLLLQLHWGGWWV